MNEFIYKNGKIEHLINGELRAVVQEEHYADYAKAVGGPPLKSIKQDQPAA